jgi:hypothetical protein
VCGQNMAPAAMMLLVVGGLCCEIMLEAARPLDAAASAQKGHCPLMITSAFDWPLQLSGRAKNVCVLLSYFLINTLKRAAAAVQCRRVARE